MKNFLAMVAMTILASTLAGAHHSTNLDYDTTKFVTVTGNVVQAKWINPHAILMFDITNAKGVKERWAAETHGAAVLARYGWRKELFKPGTQVTIWGNLLLGSGKRSMHMLKATLPGGKALDVNRPNP